MLIGYWCESQSLTSISTATALGLDGCCSIPSRGKRFSSLHRVQRAMGLTQTPIQWLSGALSSGVKLPTPRAQTEDGGSILPLHHSSSCTKSKAILVTGRGILVVSLTHRPRSTPQKPFLVLFLLEAE
jgi:hypothetical protein